MSESQQCFPIVLSQTTSGVIALGSLWTSPCYEKVVCFVIETWMYFVLILSGKLYVHLLDSGEFLSLQTVMASYHKGFCWHYFFFFFYFLNDSFIYLRDTVTEREGERD